MQTLSSARRTCMASASAVECTATVAMPSSLHARKIRSAISPRLAMRILSNILSLRRGEWRIASGEWTKRRTIRYSPLAIRLLNNYQRLAELDRLAVLDEDLRHRAVAGRRNLVHGFHRFDDDQRLPGRYLGSYLDEGFCAGLGGPIHRADHGRGHHARMFGDVGNRRRACGGSWRTGGRCIIR